MKSFTLTLGAKRSWGHCPGGQWKFDKETRERDGKTVVTKTHVPSVHRNVTALDAIVEGLIVAASEWEEHAKAGRTPHGYIDRMIRVTDVKKAGPDPVPANATSQMAAFAKEIAEQLAAALGKAPKHA